MKRAARHVVHDPQIAGILPLNRGIRAATAAPDFPRAVQLKIAGFGEPLARSLAQLSENICEARQNITQTGQIACCGFGKGHSPGTAAGAGANAASFDERDGFACV